MQDDSRERNARMKEGDVEAWKKLRADLDATDMAAQVVRLQAQLETLATVVDTWSNARRPLWWRSAVAMVLATAWMAPSVLALWSAGTPLQSALRWAILPTMGFVAMLLPATILAAIAHLAMLERVTDAIRTSRLMVTMLDREKGGR